MVAETLPALIEPEYAATHTQRWQMTLPQQAFSRLVSQLVSADGDVKVDLRFFREAESGFPAFELTLESDFNLACQRTLEPFDHPVREHVQAVLVPSEAAAELVPEAYEPWLHPDATRIDPMTLIEDELLLAIPLSPRQPGEPLVWRDEGEGEQASVDHPFEALAALKKQKPN